MSNEVVVVFTGKSTERILREGGTSSWRLDRNHARQCVYAVCTQNSHADGEWADGREEHGSAFLIGKVKDVVLSPFMEGRYLIQFSEYARVKVQDVWKGDRNPVKYEPIETLGINLSTLKWEPMPNPDAMPRSAPPPLSRTVIAPLTMIEAKKGLALTYGVSPDAIEIIIRG